MPPASLNVKIIVEKTPSYIKTNSVSRKMYEQNKYMKFLFIYKNPIDRLISDYHHVSKSWFILQFLCKSMGLKI